MFGDNTDPRELVFWKNRFADRTLLSALTMYPEHAKSIFGAVPVMRKDVLQLGMILGARELLAEPLGHSTFNIRDLIVNEELQASFDALTPEEQSVCLAVCSPEKHDELVRTWARRIIQDATGVEPPTENKKSQPQ